MKVTVAVLDNGIDLELFETIDAIADFMPRKMNNTPLHGSKVVATIEKYYPFEKKYYIYDIFRSKNSIVRVIEIMKQLILIPVDIVVMSFTINKLSHREELELLCNELKRKGVVILASDGKNKESVGFPAKLDSVIGVGAVIAKTNNLYWKEGHSIQIYGNVTPEYVQIGSQYWLFNGTSKVNAIVAAQVLKIIKNKAAQQFEIEEELKKICMEKQEGDMLKLEVNLLYKNEQLKKEIIALLPFDTRDESNNILFSEIGLTLEEIGEMVLRVLENFGMINYCMEMDYYDFFSFHALINFIGRKTHEKDKNNRKDI